MITDISGFIFKNQWGKEENKIINSLQKNNIDFKVSSKPIIIDRNWIPYGGVSWVEAYMGNNLPVDYFPSFLNNFISRKIWYSDKWTKQKAFVKPADRHKRFTGFVAPGGWSKKKKGPLVYSEIVEFVNEWRFYVSKGEIVAREWYFGKDEEKIAPELEIKWPDNWHGLADFGELKDGRIELIEVGPPACCGWYGKDDDEIFVDFIINGWRWLFDNEYVKQPLDLRIPL